MSGLPSYLLSPIYGPFELLPIVIRAPFVIVSIFIGLFISLIIFELTKNKKFSLISFFVSLINPWLYFYSRQPTEAPFALLFALIGIYLFFKLKFQKIIYPFIFFILSFYSYFGAKPVIPVLLLSLSLFNKKLVIISISFVLLLTSSYFYISKSLNGSTLSQRSNQITFLNLEKYAEVVNQNRRVSVDFLLKEVFYNKFTVFAKITTSKFVNQFSPEFLFLSGDGVVPFADHGVLYLLDGLMIIIALYYFSNSKDKGEKNLLVLCLILFISGSVASTISTVGNQFVFRSFLHIPLYIILISYGIYKFNFKVVVVGLYILLFINFLIFFLFRYSIDQQDNHFITERIVASYLNRTKLETIVVTSESERIYYQTVFYNKHAQRKLFTNICPKIEIGKTYLIDSKLDCTIDGDFVVIQSQKDSGVKYRIYDDKLCNFDDLTPYRRVHFISDYDVERLDDKIFCNRWIQNGKTN